MPEKVLKKKLFQARTTGISALHRLQLKYQEFFLIQITWNQQKPVVKINSIPTSDQVMEEFFRELKKVKRVYKLNHLNIELNVNVLYNSGKDFRKINTELSKYVRKSSYFAVKFSNYRQIIKNDKIYRNLANLRSFSIEMTEYSGFGDLQLRILLSNITRYMKHVRNLKLCFSDSHVKNIGDERLNYHLKNLKNLSINLERNSNFSDTGLKHLGLRISKNSRRLNSLFLSLVSCDSISDQGVKEFAHLLGSNLKSLKTTKINFASSQKIRSGSLSSLLMELGVNSASVEELSFNFRRCKGIALEPFTELTKSEQQLSKDRKNKHLKKVSLNFEQSSLELNERSQRVAEVLGLLPKSIQELVLDFTSCRGLNKAFIERLGKNLSNHKGNLQKLEIYFGWCENISDEYVLEIGKHISSPLEALKDISLSFGWSDHVSDKCFENFMLNLTLSWSGSRKRKSPLRILSFKIQWQ